MNAPNFVRKTGTEGLDLVTISGEPAIGRYPALRAFLLEHRGLETAALFAEPVTARGAIGGSPDVSWYAAVSGDPRPLGTLDAEMRARPEALLRSRLADLAPLLDDPQYGALLRAALNVAAASDVLVIDDVPVLTNWGLLPAGVARDEPARRDHFARTLGAYAAFDAPPLDGQGLGNAAAMATLAVATASSRGPEDSFDSPASGDFLAAAPSDLDPAMNASAQAGAGNQPPPPPPSSTNSGTGGNGGEPPLGGSSPAPPPGGLPPGGQTVVVDVPWHRRPWLPVLIAVIVSVALLLFLLLPGVLIYPERQIAEGPDLDRLIALQRESNGALEDQIRLLEEALDHGVCTIQDPRLGIPGTIVPITPGEDGARLQRPIVPAERSPTILPEDAEA